MTIIAYRDFKGEIPRTEPHLLPDSNAQLAVDCDFANGSVKPIKGGFFMQSMQNNPVRGIYTEDGLNFYTWPQETLAFNSPVIDDTNNRVYYLTPSEGIFRVASKVGMTPFGPSPAPGSQWKAGVPRPTTAPKLSLINRTTLHDFPNISVVGEAWWEDGSAKQYNRTAVTMVEVTPLRAYSFNKPARPDQPTGENVVAATYTLSVRITFKNTDDGTEIMSALIRPGVTSRSNSLPGGVEFSIDESSSEVAVVNMAWGVVETRAYVYTAVNTWEEEGAPSPPSTISLTYIQDVQIEVTAVDFTGYRPGKVANVYRTFGTSATYIQIEYEYPGSGLIGYDRSWKPKVDGHALQSEAWTPPQDGLQGVVLAPNGWFAAFKDNTLYMSEPYRPHAWPYSMTFAKAIRGVCVGQQSIVVTTADGVYAVAGAHPSAAQQINLNTPQPGIAQRSMTQVEGAVAYASNDGIVFVSGSSASSELGQKLFDRGTWRARYGNQITNASMRFAYHDGALVSASATESNGFLLRMDENIGSFTRLSAKYDCMFFLPVNDALYYTIGNALYQFRGGSPGSFTWHSKDFIFPMQNTFGAGFIRCDQPTTITIYGDGVQVAQKTVTTGHFRLPANMPRRLRWSFKLESAGAVYECMLGRSMMELQNV